MKAAPALFIIAHFGLLCGCLAHKQPVTPPKAPPPAATANAEQVADLLRRIAAALPSYKEDGLARFEGPEIASVENDLKRFGNEDGDAVFPEDYAQIEADWEQLVGLDQTLQREHLI